jgi:hypothetical protein
MTDQLTRDEFAAHLNTKFDVYLTDEAPVEAELVEVTIPKKYGKTESFAILFIAPPGTPLTQQICKVEHPKLGSIELFLVPVGQNETGTQFEAVFNRLMA